MAVTAADPTAEDLPGLPEGRFQALEVLGRGTFGRVVRMRDLQLKRSVVVKWVSAPPGLRDFDGLAERVLQEARILAQLHHPGVVQLLDFGRGDSSLYLVYPDHPAEDLERILSRRGRLSVPEALELVEQVLAALEALHAQQVVHRDLKPGNILQLRDSGRYQLIDLGLAKDLQAGLDLTVTNAILGTPLYLSPEQVHGEDPDPRDDLYSVGVLAWRALAGHNPFQAPSVREVLRRQLSFEPPPLHDEAPEVPPGLGHWVARMMAKDRDARPASASAAGELLEGARRGAATARAPSAGTRPLARARPDPAGNARSGQQGERPVGRAEARDRGPLGGPLDGRSGTRTPGIERGPPGLLAPLVVGACVAFAGLALRAASVPSEAPATRPPGASRLGSGDPGGVVPGGALRGLARRWGLEAGLPGRVGTELDRAATLLGRVRQDLERLDAELRAGRLPGGELGRLARLDAGLLGGEWTLARMVRRGMDSAPGRDALAAWMEDPVVGARVAIAAARRAVQRGARDRELAAILLAQGLAEVGLALAPGPASELVAEAPRGRDALAHLEAGLRGPALDQLALQGHEVAAARVDERALWRQACAGAGGRAGWAAYRLMRSLGRSPSRRRNLLGGPVRTPEGQAMRRELDTLLPRLAGWPALPRGLLLGEVLRVEEKDPEALGLDEATRARLRDELDLVRGQASLEAREVLARELGRSRFYSAP